MPELLGADDLDGFAVGHDGAQQQPHQQLWANAKPDLLLLAQPKMPTT
jgi:hypothetical protein